MSRSGFRPPSGTQNPMSLSNPIGFNKNSQSYNPNYASQLQEQFFKITQFCQESSYNPKKTNSGTNSEVEERKESTTEENVRFFIGFLGENKGFFGFF